jgi:hypothetical protein
MAAALRARSSRRAGCTGMFRSSGRAAAGLSLLCRLYAQQSRARSLSSLWLVHPFEHGNAVSAAWSVTLAVPVDAQDCCAATCRTQSSSPPMIRTVPTWKPLEVSGTLFEVDEVHANGLVRLQWHCLSRSRTDKDVPKSRPDSRRVQSTRTGSLEGWSARPTCAYPMRGGPRQRGNADCVRRCSWVGHECICESTPWYGQSY